MGVLIAIEGTDASGKQTQAELLLKRLTERGTRARLVSFPAYESDSSWLVRMYLNGEFGSDPNDVNAYAASTFYAADRFATFRRDWKRDYDNGVVIIADRYVSSNIIHQAAKLNTSEEKLRFRKWLTELEYSHFGLPIPDLTVFLDMPYEIASKLMAPRKNKIDSGSAKDIHERSLSFMKASYENAVNIANELSWTRVSCSDGGNIRAIDDISDEILDLVLPIVD